MALRDDLNLQREYLLEILKRSRGMEVLIQRPDYIHATSRSRLFGFVDDFEAKLEQTPKGTFVHFRSASRVGYSDLGVNKKRILRIVNQLQEKNRLASDSLNEAL